MTNKILIAKNVSRGNLISPNYEQSYYLYFLPKVLDDGKVSLCEKSRIELVAPSSNGEDVVKSYQMIDPAQVELLMYDVFKLWCFHKRYKDEFNDFILNAFINKFVKKSKDIGKDIQEGLYDEGVKL